MIPWLLSIVAAVLLSGYLVHSYDEGQQAKIDKERRDAQDMVQALSDKAVDDADAKMKNDAEIYRKGIADGRAQATKIAAQSARNIAADPALQNPVCVLSPNSLALLAATINGVRSGVDSALLNVQPAPPVVVSPLAPATTPPATSGKPPKPIPRKRANP